MSIKEQVKELWRLCFNDGEAFTELYFQYRYSNEVNITLQENGTVISALQLLPYPMTLWGSTVPTSYISGACTHPDFQGKGAMKQLLTRSFLQMYEQGVAISTLIPAEPWLFQYYARTGYASVFNYSIRQIPASSVFPQKNIATTTHSTYRTKEYEYLTKKMSERHSCLQHTEEDYQVIVADLALAEGSIITAYQENKIVGIAFVVPEKNILYVKELLAESKEIENHLLYEGSKLHTSQIISVITPYADENNSKIQLGMARVINVRAVLELYAATHPERELNIALTDTQIPANSGFYMLSNGECKYSQSPVFSADREITIEELTKILLSPEKPYMSLMLN